MTVEEAIAVVEQLNADGIDASLDSLGESVMQVSQAEESAAVYHRLLDAIAAKKLRANVSVKLTQVGMDIGGHGAGPALAERIVAEMVEHADAADTFVRIDMEGSDYTEATVAMTERLHARWPGRVGTVLQ
ncbi:MAG: proline dehydrogenase family protein, partial [Acidobacteriota bacterium]|nr:proline dehydrogenase family protein [Acidobacteriota bacterium]